MEGQVALTFARLPSRPPTPDPDDAMWWRAWAACRGVPSEVFYPTDLSRIGPRTRQNRQDVVDAVKAGEPMVVVAERFGVELRLVRYWMTLTSRQLVPPVRKTTNRPGVEAARAFCLGCQVRVECGEWALANGETDGVWGGMDPEERKIELRRRRQRIAS